MGWLGHDLGAAAWTFIHGKTSTYSDVNINQEKITILFVKHICADHVSAPIMAQLYGK